jgi:hypothetical protein
MAIGRLLLLTALAGCARGVVASAPVGSNDPRLDRVVADYVGLWRRETLDQWEKLFLPGFTTANTRADGTTSVRTRQEFFDAQRRYHARVGGLREDLENVRIERHGPLASVWADFVVTDSGQKNRGKLVLLIIEDHGEYKIHSLMFAYDR